MRNKNKPICPEKSQALGVLLKSNRAVSHCHEGESKKVRKVLRKFEKLLKCVVFFGQNQKNFRFDILVGVTEKNERESIDKTGFCDIILMGNYPINMIWRKKS